MMTDKMKFGLVVGIIVIAFIIQLVVGISVGANNTEVNDESLRLRVIAHSDDALDQVVKRVVGFAVVDFLNQYDYGYSPESIIYNLDGVRTAIEEVLDDINVDVDAQINLEHHYFPDSSDYYVSLVVRLGDGDGENWWCFINPGVCTIPSDEYISANEIQTQHTQELQEDFGTRTISFIGGLFGGESDHHRVMEGEIDWFLFDDEK